MTITYTCQKCGASLTIETDQKKEAEKRVKQFEKKHRCKRVTK